MVLANHTTQLGSIHTDITDTNTRIDILNQTLLNTVQIIINGTNVSLTQIMMDIVTLQSQVAALQSQVANLTSVGTPTGSILPWSGSIASIPSGYHLCDGSMPSNSNPLYTPLYAVIGCTFCTNMTCSPGVFCLPNLMGKVPVGEDTGAMHFGMRGTSEGETEHTLSEMEMPNHQHTANAHGFTQTTKTGTNADGRHFHDILLGPNDLESTDFPGILERAKRGFGAVAETFVGGARAAGLTGGGIADTDTTAQSTDGNHILFFSKTWNSAASTCITADNQRFGALDGGPNSYRSAHSDKCPPTDSAHTHQFDIVVPAVNTTFKGSSMPHNNIQPSLVVNYMIKL